MHAIAVNAYTISRKGRGMSTIGAAAGLVYCMSNMCRNISFNFYWNCKWNCNINSLVQLQTFFIAISIPVLLITPYIMARKLRNADGSCKIQPTE